jgi:hypothetical protein
LEGAKRRQRWRGRSLHDTLADRQSRIGGVLGWGLRVGHA